MSTVTKEHLDLLRDLQAVLLKHHVEMDHDIDGIVLSFDENTSINFCWMCGVDLEKCYGPGGKLEDRIFQVDIDRGR